MVVPSGNYPANNSGSAVDITIEGRGTRGHDWRVHRDDRCDRRKSQNPYSRLGKVSIESLHLSIVLYWNQKDYDTGSTRPGSTDDSQWRTWDLYIKLEPGVARGGMIKAHPSTLWNAQNDILPGQI